MTASLAAPFVAVFDYFDAQPSLVVYGANMALALLVSFGVHLSAHDTGLVTTVATAVSSIIVALKTRPWGHATATGIISTVVTAAAAFGFHASANSIAVWSTLISSGMLAWVWHHASPSARQSQATPVSVEQSAAELAHAMAAVTINVDQPAQSST